MAIDALASTDLTDAELDSFEYHGCSSGTSTSPMVRDAIVRAVAEVRRHRTALNRMTPVIAAADAWRDDPCKGLGSHREAALADAIDDYRTKVRGAKPDGAA